MITSRLYALCLLMLMLAPEYLHGAIQDPPLT
jgi:hypothetical protein